MKLHSVVVLMGIVCLAACSDKHQDKTGIQGKGGGQGTVNVSGDINKSSNFGGTDSRTIVSCIRDPRINYSSIALSLKGSSKFVVDAEERLHANFDSGDFPTGNFSFVSGNTVTYSTKDSSYGSQGRDCSGTFSRSGNKLTGQINCRGMLGGQSGTKLVNVSSSFECEVVTF